MFVSCFRERGFILVETTYERVIPRDLFNEAKLLMCLGKMSLLIHNQLCPMKVQLLPERFIIRKDDSDGSIFCTNPLFFFLNGQECNLSCPLNSRESFPLVFYDDEHGVVGVFDDKGNISAEFGEIILANKQK